jgi:IS5 family transposase
MLRKGSAEPRQPSFSDLARVRVVPPDHELLRMKRAVDWACVDTELARYYDTAQGRPGYPPQLLVRLLYLEVYANLSDRQVAEQVGYNLLYREFVGLSLEEAVPDDTTLVTFRQRVGEAGLRTIFDRINAAAKAAGLIGTTKRVTDGTHVLANVALRGMAGFLRHGRTVVLRTLAEQDPAEAARLAERYAGEPQALDGDEAGRIAREAQRCDELLAELGPGPGDAVQARAAQLRRVLQRLREPADQKTTDAPVSFEDLDCRFGHKSKDVSFLGYKVHQALDPDSRLVLSVETLPGNANEAVEVGTLVSGETGGLPAGAAVIGDGLYGNTTATGQVEAQHGVPVFAGMAIARVSDRFTYDAPADQMVCPQGKRSVGSIEQENGRLYYFAVPDCAACPGKAQCLTPSELARQQRRRVYLSHFRKPKVIAGAAGKQWRRQMYRERYKIEGKHAEQKDRHGLRRARYWGLPKVSLQAIVTATVTNLKRLAKLLAPGQRLVPQAA